jgi:hypothetical protein
MCILILVLGAVFMEAHPQNGERDELDSISWDPPLFDSSLGGLIRSYRVVKVPMTCPPGHRWAGGKCRKVIK